ncbi:MAG: carbohydrate ABC transporter permease [Spirochaetaceae bacterium]|nr:carbohydrate ABC transporter permease [Spirochaetaceae bacterium]MCF7948166.1 carbohydrate ABC transporter permease [Spirochaetia bacterium]MCF7951030.1 carbohydrate ABC transporter permease [Spirochaetaceae bacterium]
MKMVRRREKILFIFVGVFAILFLFPVVWMFLTSIRTTQDLYKYPPTLIPHALTLENFVYIFTEMGGFIRYVVNSLVVTISTVLIVLVSSAMGGYAFGMRKFRGQNIMFMLVVGVLTIPYIMYLIPIFLMEYEIGLQNTWLGLIFPYVALNLPWGLLIMRGAFSTIPLDIRDAAIIDGCTEIQMWRRILVPINRPALAATTIITFVFAWQEYMFASTLMTKNEWQTLPVGIVWLRDELQTLVMGRVGAMVIVTILPVLILFFIFRDFFIEGLSEGMLKG